MGDRCTGQCCKHFFLPADPEEIRKSLENQEFIRGLAPHYGPGLGPERSSWPHPDVNVWRDIETIAPMVNLVRVQAWSEEGILLEQPKHYYRCSHLQENGDCGIYDRRPDMCSRYPYGSPCEHGSSCEWDDAREGRVGEDGRVSLPQLSY